MVLDPILTVEVVGAEGVVLDAVTKHVVRGCEHRGGHGPGDQMAGSREARHVHADLRDHAARIRDTSVQVEQFDHDVMIEVLRRSAMCSYAARQHGFSA